MTDTDELREQLIELSVPFVKARVAQFELEQAIAEMADSVTEEMQELAADIQYFCFLAACKQADVDPNHKAFDPFRLRYKAAIEHSLFVTAAMN